jgi:uncharacterized protein
VQEGIGATRKVDVDGTIQVEGRPPERVVGTAELLRTKIGVLVRAHLSLVEPEACSRCLKPLEETIHIDFEEEFQSTVDIRSGEAVEERDPDAFTIDEHHMLDLTEAVRQYREVSGEMAPLCRPDCKGLCPTCGQDLNQGACDCDRESIDSRWQGLAALRSAISEGKE